MRKRFKAAMDDDFNTPEAVAVLFDLANEVNKSDLLAAGCAAQGTGRRAGFAAARSSGILARKNNWADE